MNRGIYSAASGMVASQTKLDILAHNLANVTTTGYKADRIEFSEYMERVLRGDGGLGKVLGTIGTGPVESQRFVDMEVGAFNATGNPLDLAIRNPRSAFAVKNDQNQTLYTRSGSFRLNPAGEIVTMQGHKLLDTNGQPIQINGKSLVKIGANGEVEQNGGVIAQIGFFESDKFEKVGDNMWRTANATRVDAEVEAGTLEGSNVNAVEAMIDMIKVSRLFELSQKMIQAEDESNGKLIQGLQER
jgi:flagellar basal-body rod protein FlgF